MVGKNCVRNGFGGTASLGVFSAEEIKRKKSKITAIKINFLSLHIVNYGIDKFS